MNAANDRKAAVEAAVTIAEKAAEKGGRVFYVGGCVRDELLGRPLKDTDIEVHGLEPGELFGILESLGEALVYGESFGIYSLKGLDLDVALPRREKAVGRGHRDFEVSVDPFIGPEAAARRRDFTVNALMKDVLSGEILDFFGGLSDLEAKVLRHVNDESFAEDPLRVLRAAQFSARLRFAIAPETVRLCAGIDISTLSKERVEAELKKALLEAEKPSIFFEALKSMGKLSPWFTELESLIGLEQDPLYHPEGDVWVHTMEVLDRAAEYRSRVSDPYSFMLLALTHDLGKTVTTESIGGRIHAYEHEKKGLPLAESFVTRFCSERAVTDYVLNMVPLHMKPNVVAYKRSAVRVTNHMFDEARAPEDLIYFALADRPVMAGNESFSGDSAFLLERLKAYRETMAKPFVQGRDLIEAGIEPGPRFSEYLAFARKLRLAGIEKDSALKQTLSVARKAEKLENKGRTGPGGDHER
ncbi:MAG: tRNA nucleotidyltransferase [Firmicutes bacterium]|nr:tRNA nucleotidyltransferase [Bacillota bacterium]